MITFLKNSSMLLKSACATAIVFAYTSVGPQPVNPVTPQSANANSIAFFDTEGHWANSYINWALEEHLTSGYEDGSFKPNRAISEPEFLAMLLRAYSLVEQPAPAGSAWYAPYYDYAQKLGWPVTYVTSNTAFTRGQAARLIATAATGNPHTIQSAIRWLLDEGISKGRTSATVSGFEPNGLLTRAEALTFYYKLKLYTNSLSTTKIAATGYSLSGVSIDDYETKAKQLLGNPARTEASGYSFTWHVYNDNDDYSQYQLIGIQNGRVVALYSGSKGVWRSETGVAPGITIAEAKQLAGSVQDPSANDDYYVYTSEGIRTTLFIDRKDGNKVIGMLLIKQSSLAASSDKPSADLQNAAEQQVFDLANAERARRGIPILAWDKLAAAAARAHSADMANRDYFGHSSPDGLSPFDRMKAKGVSYSLAAENIAAGYANAIYAHYGWMNSDSGHRETLLNSKLKKLGTGVAFGSSNSTYDIYYTQDFYSPR